MAVDKRDYVVTTEAGPVTTATLAAIQASVDALPPRIDYSTVSDVERGRDDLEVSNLGLAWVLKKTIAMEFLTEEKATDTVDIEMHTTNAPDTAYVQFRVVVEGGAETVIHTWSSNSVPYERKSHAFARTYGYNVLARFYLSNSSGMQSTFERLTRVSGAEKRKFVYL